MIKVNKKYQKIILIVIIIVLIELTFLLTQKGILLFEQTITTYKLKNLNYTNQSIDLIIENDIDKYLLDNNIYSKTLETALIEDNYNESYLDTYLFFEYKNYDKYIEHLNKLKDKGYSNDEINIILEHLEKDEIDIIFNYEKINNLGYYITDNYFKINNLERYINYKKENSTFEYENIINNVNLNLDYEFYEYIQEANNVNSISVLVNKYYKLDEDFEPNNLTALNSEWAIDNKKFVAEIAKKPFEEMCSDMKSIGLNIKAISTYRSYNTQQDLYNRYVKKDGEEEADTYSARPGHSEHQTGLAIDAYNITHSYLNFDQTNEYAWLKNNAHQYGFIIRYPEGKEYITGYMYEPWHFRYVGEEIASYIYYNNITFDEYYAKFID